MNSSELHVVRGTLRSGGQPTEEKQRREHRRVANVVARELHLAILGVKQLDGADTVPRKPSATNSQRHSAIDRAGSCSTFWNAVSRATAHGEHFYRRDQLWNIRWSTSFLPLSVRISAHLNGCEAVKAMDAASTLPSAEWRLKSTSPASASSIVLRNPHSTLLMPTLVVVLVLMMLIAIVVRLCMCNSSQPQNNT
jgi:hypothetical protein